jgi:hypothetical protein
MQYGMIAISLVVAMICLVIANTVIFQATGNGNATGNFSGISFTTINFLIPLLILGLIIYVVYAAVGSK